jgi:hypothetical protein
MRRTTTVVWTISITFKAKSANPYRILQISGSLELKLDPRKQEPERDEDREAAQLTCSRQGNENIARTRKLPCARQDDDEDNILPI